MANAALELLSTPLTELAAELGVSVQTLRSYRIGRRAPSAKTAADLGKLCERRSKALHTLAEQLKGAAQ
jgi:transcriptional regulator with XRE-family HTH domain